MVPITSINALGTVGNKGIKWREKSRVIGNTRRYQVQAKVDAL